MKLSRNQQNLQKKINKLLLAGIPLTTLISSTVYAKETPSPTIGIPPMPSKTIETPAVSGTEIYIVKPRDTMFKIAKLYGTTVEKLCELNKIPLQKADVIKVGQKLIVPKRNSQNENKQKMPVREPDNRKNENNRAVPVGCMEAPENNAVKEQKSGVTIRGEMKIE